MECSCRLWPTPGMYAVTSWPLVRRTRATLRKAEFGFFGVFVYTRVQTPRRWGAPRRAGVFVFVVFDCRPLRTSWEIVGIPRLDLTLLFPRARRRSWPRPHRCRVRPRRRRRQPRVGGQRRLGDAHELGTALSRRLALLHQLAVDVRVLTGVDALAGQEAGVAGLGHRHPTQHLANDQLDVLVVDRHALVPV